MPEKVAETLRDGEGFGFRYGGPDDKGLASGGKESPPSPAPDPSPGEEAGGEPPAAAAAGPPGTSGPAEEAAASRAGRESGARGRPASPAEAASTDGGRETTLDGARTLEEMFVRRFEVAFDPVREIFSPLEGEMVPASRRDRDHVKRNRSSRIVELMKKHRVYDRALLDRMPMDEISEFRIVERRFFGGYRLRVRVSAMVLSPAEDLLLTRRSSRPVTPFDVEEALDALGPRDDVFHYVGVLATTGFADDVPHRLPAARNLRMCLVEPVSGTRFRLIPQGSREDWGRVADLFDPETEEEKAQRVTDHLRALPSLGIRGGHVSLKEVREVLQVPEDVIRRAVEAVLNEDPDLSLQVVAGLEVLKRRRI